jgi:glycosyltransferase involved in cell wall biosynthesis
MRVVIVSKTFVAATAQRQLEWIACQPGIDLTLVTPPFWRSDDGRILPFASRFGDGYHVRRTPVLFNGRYHLYVYRGLRAALRELRPNLIHIDEEPYNPAAFQAQWYARRMGVPVVLVAWQNLHRHYPPPFAWMERFAYRHASAIIAGSVDAGEVLRRKGYSGLLVTFSLHGVAPELYRPMPREADDSADDQFVIGYLGRLVAYKGTGLLIEALRQLPERFRLRLIGGGPDASALRRLAAHEGVAGRVEFVAALATESVPEALARLDALVVPSLTRPNWKEQFGRVLIEAMACGVPVIGSDSGEIPHVVGDAGIIVPEGDVAALRAALLQLSGDAALRQRFARAGRARVMEQYTQERVAQNIVAVYQQALSASEARQ